MKIKRNDRNFEPAPEGTMQAVLVDIIDLGMNEDKYNPGELIPQVRLKFQTEEKTDEGTPYLVQSFPYKASVNSKSNLMKLAMNTIIGRKLTKEDFDENNDIDLDALALGKNVNITIVHKVVGENTYANIESISPLIKSQKTVLKPENYVRVQDREEAEPTHSGEAVAAFGS